MRFSASPPDPATADRALSCRSVLWARAESGAEPEASSAGAEGLEELDVRRCPVGPILALDCPEWAGTRCRVWASRGDEPPAVIARDEAAAMLAALAEEGTLSERYRRRLRPLTAEGPVPTAVGAHGAAPRAPPLSAPVGIPADRERRRAPARPDASVGDAP